MILMLTNEISQKDLRLYCAPKQTIDNQPLVSLEHSGEVKKVTNISKRDFLVGLVGLGWFRGKDRRETILKVPIDKPKR